MFVFVHGSMGCGMDTFSEQLELADDYEVMLVDRRGFGGSPPTERADYEVDASDIVELLAGGAHLVGHSYGAVVSLVAASRQPESIRSLVLIEPPLLDWADDPAAREYRARLTQVFAEASQMTPAEFWVRFVQAGGRSQVEPPAFSAEDVAAIRTTMHERLPWDADIPTTAVKAAAFPRLVCLGGRTDADPEVRAVAGRAYAAVGGVVANRIGAEVEVFEHSAHNPQIEEAPAFNGRLRRLWWRSSDASMTPAAPR